MNDRAGPFEWSGGHPALDFVNTLDERPFESPIENLATYRNLVRFTELAGLVEPAIAGRLLRLDARAGLPVAARTRKLREHLHDILAAAHSGKPVRQLDLDAISAAVHAAHAARVLVATSSPGLARHRWPQGIAPDVPLHACALSIEHLLVNVERRRIRKCAASDCDVYYVDTSKGRHRLWCSMKGCGNREKQRRWRSTAQ
jgi:predicted RNA-binding Zn ribbon-like protein